jgi:hypothetical protein
VHLIFKFIALSMTAADYLPLLQTLPECLFYITSTAYYSYYCYVCRVAKAAGARGGGGGCPLYTLYRIESPVSGHAAARFALPIILMEPSAE